MAAATTCYGSSFALSALSERPLPVPRVLPLAICDDLPERQRKQTRSKNVGP